MVIQKKLPKPAITPEYRLNGVLNKVIELRASGQGSITSIVVYRSLENECYKEIENQGEDGVYIDYIQIGEMFVENESDVENILDELSGTQWLKVDNNNYYPMFKADSMNCYINEFYRKKADEYEKKALEAEARANSKWVKISGWIASSAASALVLIEIIKHFNWIGTIELLTAVYLFVSGVLLTTMIILIIKEIFINKPKPAPNSE